MEAWCERGIGGCCCARRCRCGNVSWRLRFGWVFNALGGTAAPLVGDSRLASRMASLESMLTTMDGRLNQSLARTAALEVDVAAKVS